jgi:GH35 family endo-1,4-beta-xylanase
MNKQLIILALGATMVASCADDFDRSYEVGRPDKVEQYAYLNDYKPLKEYLANPNMKLGVGTDIQNYMKQELVYGLVNSNFTEVVAGNEMKMSSCVKDNGEMDFGNVQQFVNMATDAGLSVYGHTLAWHSQQPAKYLNSLLKDKELDIDPDAVEEREVYSVDWTKADSYTMWGQFPEAITTTPSVDSENGLTVATTGTIPNFWELQYMVADGISLQGGKNYILRVEIKGDPASENLHFAIGPWGADIKAGVLDFTTEWETRDIAFTAADDVSGVHVLFQSGDYAGTYNIRSVAVYSLEPLALEVEQEVKVQTYTDGPFPFYPMGCEPPVIDGCIHFEPTGNWSQFFVVPGGENPLDEGDYMIYLDLTADKAADGVQLTIQNGWGGDAQNLTMPVSVEAGQHNIPLRFSGVVGGNYDIILKPQTADATLDLRSVTINKIVKMNSIPLTDEEKKDTLTWAMGRWIEGMMNACDGKVKAWDVVNEPISGTDADGDGYYDLQHESSNTSDFFWQNYLGDVDYVRTAVKFARQFGPEGVKLFINDYNLEYDWDASGNKKLESLIHWISVWEQDGTKIDGIGSQMHISYYMNAAEQQKRQQLLENSFRLMAATGKLVRISELDMGLVDANGKEVNTVDVTEEQHKAMAEYYKWIIQKYLEIVPQAQQWGITQWCITDSPADSGWRKGQPTGLWDQNYNRKHTYAGFADGLQSK